ncbi:hypothetical protein ABIE27_005015 [Paenibacillus sp. 4624]
MDIAIWSIALGGLVISVIALTLSIKNFKK